MLLFQGIGPFHLGSQICGHRVVCGIPLLSFYCSWICNNDPSFISDVSNLCSPSFFLVSLARGLSILLIFFKDSACFCWFFSIDFLFSISLISALHLFSSAYFGFNLLLFFFFSCFLWWKLRLLILDLYSFWIQEFNAINFPLSTAFAAFHTFW